MANVVAQSYKEYTMHSKNVCQFLCYNHNSTILARNDKQSIKLMIESKSTKRFCVKKYENEYHYLVVTYTIH